MANLKDLKLQINSVSSTKKITSAMKMVAASKLRRSQERAESARPYSSRIEEMLASLASSSVSGKGVIKLLTGTGKKDNYLVVPVTADRGLCGGFNSSINRETLKYIKTLEKEGKKINFPWNIVNSTFNHFLIALLLLRISLTLTQNNVLYIL